MSSHTYAIILPLHKMLQKPLEYRILCLIGTLWFCGCLQAYANVVRVGFRPFLLSRSGGQGYFRHSGVFGHQVDKEGHIQNALTLTTVGWGLAPLHKFIELCREFMRKNLNGTTTVYFSVGRHSDIYSGGGGWQSVSKAVRKLDTVDMDETIKAVILQDAEYYYSEVS